MKKFEKNTLVSFKNGDVVISLMKDLTKKKKILLTLGIVLIIAVSGTLIWMSQSYDPMQEALDALESDDDLSIENGREWITFKPKNVEYTMGVIFYPGGNVEPESYSIVMRGLAEQGIIVFIAKFPFDLAVFAINRAEDKIAEYSGIETWVMGGHSLGAAMACTFIHDNPGVFDKLILLAGYPGDTYSIADQNIDVISIYGSLDQTMQEEVEGKKTQLPLDTQYFEIEGGNHANVGSYGFQSGDNEATIPRADQQNQTIELMSNFLFT